MEKIVVLDGYTNNPGDLDWSVIRQFGELTVYDRTAPEEIVERSKDASILLINKVIIDAEIMDSLPNLKYIGLLSTGTNAVELDHAATKNICVTNIPGYGTNAVAQQVLAFMFHFSAKINIHDNAVHAGKWEQSPDFCFTIGTIHELAGATLGIIGLGAIGQQIAAVANVIGMKIVASHQSSMNRLDLPYDVEWLPVDDVIKRADYLTLNCPLTPDTENMVNEQRLNSMKTNATLINTGRGQLIDENALANALNNDVIAGAGLDVLCTEPPSAENPLLKAKNCVITPHIAWASLEARKRLLDIAAENVAGYVNGATVNKVN